MGNYSEFLFYNGQHCRWVCVPPSKRLQMLAAGWRDVTDNEWAWERYLRQCERDARADSLPGAILSAGPL